MDMVRALQVLHVVHYVNTQFVYTAVFIHTYILYTPIKTFRLHFFYFYLPVAILEVRIFKSLFIIIFICFLCTKKHFTFLIRTKENKST